jgi:2-dehydropantoate 2-reductase
MNKKVNKLEETMRYAVFGTGGVGGYFGGRLAEAGEDVTFIARGAHLEAIRKKGLVVHSVSGDFTITPAGVTDRPDTVGAVDAVILGVKAWQLREAAEAILPLIGPETAVLPLENGVEAAEDLTEVLGKDHVLGGLCAIVSMIESPGVIRHAGIDPVIRFGELDNTRSDRVSRMEKDFQQCRGVTVEVPDDIQRALWQKFVFISAWSSVGSVTRAPIGVIRSIPESRELLLAALAEAVEVGRAGGINLPAEIVENTVNFYDSVDPTSTASMQRDVAAGKPSELEAQTGAVVRLGKKFGVATPASRCIYQALLPGERIVRGDV